MRGQLGSFGIQRVCWIVHTRKILTMHGAFHQKSDVDRLYLKRKDGERGLISVFDCVKLEEENLLKYVTDRNEWML